LAYSGGAFVMAESFAGKPIPIGGIFFLLLSGKKKQLQIDRRMLTF
jgi:hypothetical protein